jgi:hypothetical protein
MTPDFVIKRNDSRTKTIIFDVYIGSESDSDSKKRYKALSFFADFRVITQHNFTSQLLTVLPQEQELSNLFDRILLLARLYQIAQSLVIQTFPEVPDTQKAAKMQ